MSGGKGRFDKRIGRKGKRPRVKSSNLKKREKKEEQNTGH